MVCATATGASACAAPESTTNVTPSPTSDAGRDETSSTIDDDSDAGESGVPVISVAPPSGSDALPDAGPAAPAAQLALGHAHSCALLTDGTVRCWGSNVAGELGDGTRTTRAFPYPIWFMNGVVEIGVATDGHRTCARLGSGSVLCWGEVDDLGPEHCTLDAPPIAVGCVRSPLPFPSPAGIVGLGVGDQTYARFSDGTASCLGGPSGALADLADVAELSFGASHGCARIYDGTVRCWGDGAIGQLGASSSETCNSVLGTNPCSSTPVQPDVAGVSQLASGHQHTCALLTDGTVECWGSNDAGQLGFGALDTCTKYGYPCSNSPGKVIGLAGVAQIAAGGRHTCARLNDGTVRCWGSDADGELGFPATETCNGTEEQPCATRATIVPGLTHVVEIALGRRHTCARLDDGRVACWGWNGDGQLGDGTKKSRFEPKLVDL